MAAITGTKFCIFRVGEKYHNVKDIKGFEGHMLRTFETPNANKLLQMNNEILRGDFNIVNDVKEYIKNVKIRKNAVIARDLLITASPEFFKGKSKIFINKWVDCNLRFLNKYFGDNIRFAVLHMDETTPHIHALLVPRFENNKKTSKHKLNNGAYFDGRDKLSEWQDIYAEHVTSEFKDLHRGIKGSKTTHIKMKQYYTLVNASLDEKDMKSVIAKAENSVLLEKKVKELQELLRENLKDKENTKDLKVMIEQLKEDKLIYKETIKAISQGYKISQESIINMVKRVEVKVKEGKEEGQDRELNKLSKKQE